MNYFVLLLCNLMFLSPSQGEERWMNFPLADSYEHEIIQGEGAYSVDEYRKIFFERGLVVRHLEVQHDMRRFRDIDELKQWIAYEMAPRLGRTDDPYFVESYFELLQTCGWLDLGDGVIRFPYKQLLVLLESL
jgi:hypothetical protein